MKLKTSICLTLLALLLCIAGCTKSGTKNTFELTLKDHKTGLPIEDAEVWLYREKGFFRDLFSSDGPYYLVSSSRPDKTGSLVFEGEPRKHKLSVLVPREFTEIDFTFAGETHTRHAENEHFPFPTRDFYIFFDSHGLHISTPEDW